MADDFRRDRFAAIGRNTMPLEPQSKQHEAMEQHAREALNALIGEQVIHTLGKPDGLYKVQVRPLWEGRYRVNVLIGEDIVSAKIAGSYFVEADSGGKIVGSRPTIRKQY
jgi:hypothetical protein